MAEKRQSRGRRKNRGGGKFTPLIWIVTGALIALAIVYSNTLFQGRHGGGSSTNVSRPTNRIQSLQAVASNILNAGRTTTTTAAGRVSTTSTTSGQTQSAQYSLFLVSKSGSKVRLTEVKVDLPHSTGQLKEVLDALLAYRSEGYLNLIPFDAKIRKVWIKNRVAYIDFDDAFAYNSYGMIGYQLQVYQVVYTAAQFPTVDAVYFYMDGKPLDYLGGDGLPLHNPVYPFSYLPEFNI